MKHVSEELARFSGGRICPRNDDRRSGCTPLPPLRARSTSNSLSVLPRAPSVHSLIHSRGDHRRTEQTSQQRLPRCINTQPTCPPNRISPNQITSSTDVVYRHALGLTGLAKDVDV